MSLPRLMYILRAAPCYKYPEKLREFDDLIKSKAEEITNVKMDDVTYRQASLPVKSGGLGLPKAEEIAAPAHLSSLYATDELVSSIVPEDCPDDRIEVEFRWEELTGKSAPAKEDRSNQRLWSNMLTIRKLEALKEDADVIASARLLAASTKNASAWLFALPVASLGTLLDDAAVRIAVALRLGVQICKQHKCRCGEMVDALGLHGLSCSKSQGRFRRHASLNSLIQRSLGSAKVPSILEPPGLSRLDGKRPDGLSLFPWKNGLPLIWDVTVCDTFAI
ncbi:uncharacterized protein LOC129600865 [Paramacrobiotus metropolitanus]|uniref:uncharacterized protein LOC129600865 n=1 Tax=Paramacrobiotus metropolitanus TaxID=2943436 RepID=UPI0024457FCA|nr:uncharacterized protein LOC129600865 [Paramacrobiotus metropolitanus]